MTKILNRTIKLNMTMTVAPPLRRRILAPMKVPTEDGGRVGASEEDKEQAEEDTTETTILGTMEAKKMGGARAETGG